MQCDYGVCRCARRFIRINFIIPFIIHFTCVIRNMTYAKSHLISIFLSQILSQLGATRNTAERLLFFCIDFRRESKWPPY